MRRIPTAPVAAGVFIASWAVVAASGSRPAGGVVLAAGGAWCIREWQRRHGMRTAVELGGLCAGGFVASHVLALALGSWPAVLLVAGTCSAVIWARADARATEPARPLAFRPPAR
jgi:hypothetical protein